jgi:putative ABC transport system permease protein
MRIVRGRWFKEGESAIVINEALARRDFPGEDPLGRRMPVFGPVVGVVADLQYSRLDERPEPQFYLLYNPAARGDLSARVLVRAGDPSGIAPEIRKLVSDIDKTQPAFEIQTLEQALADSIAPRRFNLFLLGTFAIAALLLAVIGIYGVTAYSVAQRTHEIGVRMALGAHRRDVLAMVLRQGLKMALAGIAVGLAAAFALTRLMASLLYELAGRSSGDSAETSQLGISVPATTFGYIGWNRRCGTTHLGRQATVPGAEKLP